MFNQEESLLNETTRWQEILAMILRDYALSKEKIDPVDGFESPFEILLSQFFTWFREEINSKKIFNSPELIRSKSHLIAHIRAITRVSKDSFHDFYIRIR